MTANDVSSPIRPLTSIVKDLISMLQEFLAAVRQESNPASIISATPGGREEYLSIEQLCQRIPLRPQTIRNKMASGELVEGVHFYRLRPQPRRDEDQAERAANESRCQAPRDAHAERDPNGREKTAGEDSRRGKPVFLWSKMEEWLKGELPKQTPTPFYAVHHARTRKKRQTVL
jgi:hypothetical protein